MDINNSGREEIRREYDKFVKDHLKELNNRPLNSLNCDEMVDTLLFKYDKDGRNCISKTCNGLKYLDLSKVDFENVSCFEKIYDSKIYYGCYDYSDTNINIDFNSFKSKFRNIYDNLMLGIEKEDEKYKGFINLKNVNLEGQSCYFDNDLFCYNLSGSKINIIFDNLEINKIKKEGNYLKEMLLRGMLDGCYINGKYIVPKDEYKNDKKTILNQYDDFINNKKYIFKKILENRLKYPNE